MFRKLETFCELVERVAGVLLALVTLLIVASAVGRYVLATPVPDAFDLSRFLIGACIMWGFASVGYRGGHISVDLFVEMASRRWRRVIDLFAWATLLFFAVLLTWKMWGRVTGAFASNESTFDLRLPVWPLLALIWAGAAASVITIALRVVTIAIGREPLQNIEQESALNDPR
ncbi:TRAP transporter small permease [Plastorhodobacter daqingensis]|uniref:TRAP transporter small permease protein n=1 Tax=Plastorhodobacter daqingensis TaxID=1387281 RepID=A0ABW2UJJ1_9RHOB